MKDTRALQEDHHDETTTRGEGGHSAPREGGRGKGREAARETGLAFFGEESKLSSDLPSLVWIKGWATLPNFEGWLGL